LHINTNGDFSFTFTATSDTPDSTTSNNSVTLQLVAKPLSISIAALGGGGIHLSWPEVSGTYVLEKTFTLSPSAWVAVTNAPDSDGSQFLLDLPAADPENFFRLRQP
jgi:hypothetical protein